ncbi:hypothetical protein EBR21_08460, partial [bacterium]|nr:hypothetical protein [bacterium]
MQMKLPVRTFSNAAFICSIFLPAHTLAAPVQTRSVRLSEDTGRPSGFGLNLFLGGDGAFLKSSSNDEDESPKQGTLYGGKALLTLVNRDLEIEGGAGYSVSLLQGDGDIVDGETPNTKVKLQNVRIETRTALAEFSARLRLNEELEGDAVWSLGPTAAAYIGTNASFGPDTKKNYRSAIFLGGQLALQFGAEFKPRIVLSYLTDVNLYERQVHMALLSLQLGMSLFTPKTIVKDIRNQTNDEIIKKIQVEKTVEKTVVKENVRFLLDSELVNFETDKAILLKRSEVFLRELGMVLAQHPERWSAVVIEG